MTITPLIALMAAGTVAQVAGQVSAANAAADTANYNAKIQERDAYVSDQNRQHLLRMSQIEQDDKRRENLRTLSSMKAMYGTSGLDLAGSPLDVLTDSATEMETDVQRIGYEGKVKARDMNMQSLGLREGAALSRMEAKNAKSGLAMKILGTAAGGAGNILQQV